MDQYTPENPPTPNPKLTICPYCGSQSRSLAACDACRGKFDPLSRQATQNAMGPWFIRDEANPHRPGCAYETLVQRVERGGVVGDTVIRGPSSRQFWTLARWCPGVAHLLGACHNCHARAERTDTACTKCGASFGVTSERQGLGLGAVRSLPGRKNTAAGGGGEPVATALAGVARERAAGLAVVSMPETTLDPRLARMERELHRSRRWRAVWCVGFCGVALLAVGVLVAGGLDLDAGPLGKWLAAREPEEASSGLGDSSPSGIPPITTPSLGTGPDGAGEELAGSGLDTELPPGGAEVSPDSEPSQEPGDGREGSSSDGVVPEQTPALQENLPSAAIRARLETLVALRGLR